MYLYRLPSLFLIVFDRGTICNIYPLVLCGNYSKYALMIQYPCITDTRGILFSSMSGDSEDWGGYHIWIVLEILWLHHYTINWNIPILSRHLVVSTLPFFPPILFSSSPLHISPCSNWCFSLPAALSTLIEEKKPRPVWPVVTRPRISFSQSRSTAIFNSFATFHFFPVLTSMPAPEILGTLENSNCIVVITFATLYSSTRL